MEKAIKAAINGPERKKVKIKESASRSKSHEFNVKPVSMSLDHEGELIVYGQISHHLRFRKDDQHWYGFKKKGTTLVPNDVSKMLLEKKEGGLVKTIGLLKPIGIAIGAYFGVDAGKYFDTLEKHGDKISFIDMDSGYEKAILHFLSELSKEIKPPRRVRKEGLTLFQHTNFKGKKVFFDVNKNTTHLKSIGWNDTASSLRVTVPKNMKLEVFKHSKYTGNKIEFGPGYHLIRDLKIHKLGDELTSCRWTKLKPLAKQVNRRVVARRRFIAQ